MDRLPVIALALALLTLLPGCKDSGQVVDCYEKSPDRWIICDRINGYTFWYPSWIAETDWQVRDVDVSTYDFPLTLEEQKKWKSYGHNLPLTASCSPSITGVEQMQELTGTNGKTQWAKEPRPSPHGDYPGKLCHTSKSSLTKEEYWNNEGEEKAGTYVLCSEKGGKTVLICIDQVNDDPKLAEEIFKTFRWTSK